MRKTIEPILAILFLSGIVVFGVLMLLHPDEYVGDKKVTFETIDNTKMLSYISIGASGLAIVSNIVFAFIKRSLKRSLMILAFTLATLGGIAIYAAVILTKANDGDLSLTTINQGKNPQPAGVIPWQLYLMVGLPAGGAIFLAVYKAYISGDIKKKYSVQTIDLFPVIENKTEETTTEETASKIEINVVNTTISHEHHAENNVEEVNVTEAQLAEHQPQVIEHQEQKPVEHQVHIEAQTDHHDNRSNSQSEVHNENPSTSVQNPNN